MAIWPFSKKKDEPAARAEDYAPSEQVFDEYAEEVFDATEVPVHDAINGERGPFDGDNVSMDEFDFSDFGTNVLNLGSMLIPLPSGSEVQVEMSAEGPRMLHILTAYGRCTPVAFAAPNSPGQWNDSISLIVADMERDGLTVVLENGPWGQEIVGSAENGGGIVRIIGVDGPRWMLRMTIAAPTDTIDEMTIMGREITARTFVVRGDAPILAGSSLPVSLPEPLASQVQQEMIRRAKAAQEAQTEGPAQ